MTYASKTTRPRSSKALPSKGRPELVELVLEDDPTDPDNGDPSAWPEWTDRVVYTITRRGLTVPR